MVVWIIEEGNFDLFEDQYRGGEGLCCISFKSSGAWANAGGSINKYKAQIIEEKRLKRNSRNKSFIATSKVNFSSIIYVIPARTQAI